MKHALLLSAALLLTAPVMAQNTITPSPDRGPTTASPGTEATQRAVRTTSEPEMLHEYVTGASMGDMLEIESSKLALSRSRDDQVKQFAKHMVDDHTKSSSMMKDILSKEAISAKPADKLDDKHAAMLKKLQDANDTDFSRMYVRMQVDAHQQALGIHQNYAEGGTNKALVKFAKDTSGVVQSHLNMVKNLEQNMASR